MKVPMTHSSPVHSAFLVLCLASRSGWLTPQVVPFRLHFVRAGERSVRVPKKGHFMTSCDT